MLYPGFPFMSAPAPIRGKMGSGTEADLVAGCGSERGIRGGEEWPPSSEETEDLWLMTGEAAEGDAAADEMEETDEMDGLWNCKGGLDARFGGGLPRIGEGVRLV